MDTKNYGVRFATVLVGRTEDSLTTLAPRLEAAHAQHGENLPEFTIEGDGFQVRDLRQVGHVWLGVFARLKIDAPHKVDANSEEHELPLDAGDRIPEKCFFTYHARSNVVVWQNNRNVATLQKLQIYLCQILEDYASVNICMNEAELEEVLSRPVYEVQFNYSRPPERGASAPAWAQADFDRMRSLHAASGKFQIRAERGGRLSRRVGAFIRQAIELSPVEKLKIRLTDDAEPIELFLAPVKDSITVDLVGSYPDVRQVYEALEESYDRCRSLLPPDR